MRALLLHNYDKLSRIFLCILLIRNHIIFLMQFGINMHFEIFFQRLQIALPPRACDDDDGITNSNFG